LKAQENPKEKLLAEVSGLGLGFGRSV